MSRERAAHRARHRRPPGARGARAGRRAGLSRPVREAGSAADPGAARAAPVRAGAHVLFEDVTQERQDAGLAIRPRERPAPHRQQRPRRVRQPRARGRLPRAAPDRLPLQRPRRRARSGAQAAREARRGTCGPKPCTYTVRQLQATSTIRSGATSRCRTASSTATAMPASTYRQHPRLDVANGVVGLGVVDDPHRRHRLLRRRVTVRSCASRSSATATSAPGGTGRRTRAARRPPCARHRASARIGAWRLRTRAC